MWLEKWRTPLILALIALILVGGVVFYCRQNIMTQAIELTIAPPAQQIRVNVIGEVANPGVYTLESGDRLAEAVEAAGGFAADADREMLNLAMRLIDGQTVCVYKVGEVPQKIDINTADAWLLQALPGIGPALAQKIIDYRSGNGLFWQVEELLRVDGIGQAIYDRVKDYITVR